MSRTAIAIAVFLFGGVIMSTVFGETWSVTDLKALQEIVAEKANPGDIIEIAPGHYYLDSRKISVQRSGTSEAPIIIRGVISGGKRPVIDAARYNVMRGIMVFEPGVHDVILENLELCNARGAGGAGTEYSRNAAACYILGNNLTIRNCYSHHNENGLFSTHESDCVLIDACEVGYNGREKGIGEPHRTHGFYFNSKRQIVKNCYIHDSTDSENFKSRGGGLR